MPNTAGGSPDIRKVASPDGTASALKVLRVTLQDDFKMIKKVQSASRVSHSSISCDPQRFYKEILVAKRAEHDKVDDSGNHYKGRF